GGCDTAFAVLFLKRANVAADLTERIKKDPNRSGLLEGIQEPTPKRRTPPQAGQAQERGHSSFSPPHRGRNGLNVSWHALACLVASAGRRGEMAAYGAAWLTLLPEAVG